MTALAILPVLVFSTLAPASTVQDTTTWTVSNHGREAGAMTVVHDGNRVEVRYAHIDRNRGRWVFGRYELDDRGRVVRAEAGPTSRSGIPGEVEETLEPGNGPGPVGFLEDHATPYEYARAARFLLDQPGGAWVDPHGDTLRAQTVAREVVRGPGGAARLRLVMLDLGQAWDAGIWLDDAGRLFATDAGWFITHRTGTEDALPLLRAAEVAYRNARGEALAEALNVPAAGSLVIRNGNVFDVDSGTLRPGTTVVVEGDRIVAVGEAGTLETPPGATVLDATGMTVMPGMWDMHSHSILPSQVAGSPLQLSNGLTTVRDLASDLDVALSLRERADAGTIVSPRQLLAGFIEGPGAWAGPSEALARTEGEARRWVATYDSLGYRQIKLYNLIHPDLLPGISDEAQARGMRLSGHIPRGMSVEAAVRLGYDEVNHAAFLFSTFFPDSLWLPSMRPYSAVAADVAPNVDVDGPGMSALLEFLADRGTVVDGTFNIWMGGRSFLDEERRTPSAEAYGRLLKRLWDAGVPLVPGTDSFNGSSYLTELLLYERVGIPAPEVLRIATVVPAQVMGDTEYGRVEPGMVADLLLVDGDPSRRIADLEHIHRVIRAGRVYDPEAIRAAVSAGRPES